MSFDTYANFVTEVKNWINMSSLTDSQVGSLITIGEQRVNRDLWVKERETSLNITISNSVATIPADYMKIKHAYLDGTPVMQLQKRDAAWIYENYIYRSDLGRPKYFAEEAGNFIFGPVPDASYVMKGVYYKKPSDMATASTVHSVFTAYPDIYLYATLAGAALYLGQDQRLVWEQSYLRALNQAMRETQEREFNGGIVAMTAA